MSATKWLRIVNAAVVIGCVQTAMAQVRVVVKVEARVGLAAEEAPARLSPDLQAAESAGAKFIGVTEEGGAVLEFAGDFRIKDAHSALAEAHGVVSFREVIQAPFDKIDELVVMYREQPPSGESLAGLRVVDKYEPGRFVVIHSKDGFAAEELRQLADNESVAYIEPNYLYRLVGFSSSPNDPHYVDGKLWGMANIGASAAWKTVTESPIIVAVIDTGVDYTHEDLKDNIWRNPGEIPGNNKDDDGNGYVDDIHGYDFVNRDGDPKDGHGHGTHCAGTIGAVGNNASGVVGVNWKVRIMPVQIFGSTGKYAGATKVAKAIRYAVDNGARVLSNSWSGPNESVVIRRAIDHAQKSGSLFVAAASNNYGNDNDIHPRYPASYAHKCIVSVLSIDKGDLLSSFSNIGKLSVDIGAPGGGVYSTVPRNRYSNKSGTSMATPHVAGAAALIWGHPSYTAASCEEIKRILLGNARPVSSLGGKCVTGGTLNIRFLEESEKAQGAERELRGMLSCPVFAIGGETTGTVIKTARSTYELDLSKHPEWTQLAQQLDGKAVIVVGELTVREGLEVAERRIFKVNELKPVNNAEME